VLTHDQSLVWSCDDYEEQDSATVTTITPKEQKICQPQMAMA